jgi:hypothetical protein
MDVLQLRSAVAISASSAGRALTALAPCTASRVHWRRSVLAPSGYEQLRTMMVAARLLTTLFFYVRAG